jgi:hypothetical protein
VGAPIAVVVAIAVVAASVVTVGVVWLRVDNPLAGPTNGHSGPHVDCFPLSMSPRQSRGLPQWNNFSVVSQCGGTLSWKDLTFFATDSGGTNLTTKGWSLSVFDNQTSSTVSIYDWNARSWSMGGTSPIADDEVLVLETPSSISGDDFCAIDTGPYPGQVCMEIP